MSKRPSVIERICIYRDLKNAMYLTGMSAKEIEDIVGRYEIRDNVLYPNELRGDLLIFDDDTMGIKIGGIKGLVWRSRVSSFS